MVEVAAKALMPILAAGSKSALGSAPARGFTLLELLVVLTIAALLTAMVSLALPAGAERQLEQEAQRMMARLEVARAQSRASGQAVGVRVDAQGMHFSGGADAGTSVPWLHPSTSAQPVQLSLGPEPVIAAQQVWLWGAQGKQLGLFTDGVRPFERGALP